MSNKVFIAKVRSYFEHALYTRMWSYLSSYSNLVDLCMWILFMWYQKLRVSCMVVF